VHEIHIRPAVVADAWNVSQLTQSLLHYRSPDTTLPPPPEFTARFQPDALAATIASPNYRYHVAMQEGFLVGVIGVRDNQHLLHLFVAQSHHGRGIARALWHQAKAVVLEAAPEVVITVRSSLYAVDVYRHFGFVISGPRVDGPITFVPMQARIRRDG
jgi:GNAT superfamily N-acetyltransferase